MKNALLPLVAAAALGVVAGFPGVGSAFALNVAKAKQAGFEARQLAFDDGIARLKKGDATLDIRALRMLATELPAYEPYAEGDNKKEMNAALNRGDAKEALRLAAIDFERDYLDIDAHLVAMVANKTLGDARAFEHHRFVAFGIIDSIVESSDGKTPETAFAVITVREEYAVLAALGLRRKDQSLDHIGEHTFDVLTVVDPDTKAESKVYFNIDTLWAHQTKLFERVKPPKATDRGVVGGVPGGVPGGVVGGVPGGEIGLSPGEVPAGTPAPRPKMIRVSGGVLSGKALERPQPPYPEMARAADIQGAVVVEVTVSEQGQVESVRALSGHPLLRDAAVEAERGWVFTPTVIQGFPVKVIGTITFNFRKG